MNKSNLPFALEARGFQSGRCIVYPEGLDYVKVFYSLPAAISFGYTMAAESKRDFHVFSADSGRIFHCQYISDEIFK